MIGDMKANQILYADTKKLEELPKLLEKFPQVGDLVIWDVLKDARSYVVRELPKIIPTQFAINKDLVRGALKRRKVRSVFNVDGKSLGIEIVGSPLKAGRFDHSPSAPPGKGGGNKYSARITIYRDRGIKTIGKIQGADKKRKGVFIAKTGANSETDSSGIPKVPFIFFVRTGEYKKSPLGRIKRKTLKLTSKTGKTSVIRRQPIEKIRPISTIGIPQMIMTEAVSTPLLEGLAKSIDKNITKSLERSLGEMCNKLNR